MADAVTVNRFLTLTDPDGNQLFEIEEFTGREALSELFEFHLRMRRPAGAEGIANQWSGQPVVLRLRLEDGGERMVSGVFRHFVRSRRQGRHQYYSGVLVPTLWPITQNRRCRIFQDQTVPEILEELLRNYVVEFRYHRKDYDRHNHCVQYMESDFAFAQRIMEEEGIFHYFDHSRESRLVIADDSRGIPALAEPGKLRFNEAAGQAADGGRIRQLDFAEQFTVPSIRLVDYAFERTDPWLTAASSTTPHAQTGALPSQDGIGEYLESLGATAHRFDEYGPNREPRPEVLDGIAKAMERLATTRGEAYAAARTRLIAESDYLHVAPGFRFELADADDDDGAYLITSVEHNYRRSEGVGWQIGNRFECLDIDTSYRPPLRTPRPRVSGMHSAIVVGPEGVPVWTDHYGRVQIRFFWKDSKSETREHTSWVRVAQSWAGGRFGAVMIPRVGHEVLVEFLDGDPDRPVVVGSLYNAANPPPYDLPNEAGTTGFCSRTNTTNSSANDSSHLLFVDTAGKEQVHLHSQNHAHLSSEQSMVQTVGWGPGKSGDTSYISVGMTDGNTPSAADIINPIKEKIFGVGKWDAGLVQKVKGVNRRSLWGHEIDVTLGTSNDFVVGGWSQAHVGLGVSLDIGLVTNLTLGLHVDMRVAPLYSFAAGNQFHYVGGTSFTKSSKSMTTVVGGDYVEKISGKQRLTMMGGSVVQRLLSEPSGNFQVFDVAGFKAFAAGPEARTPDAVDISNIAERQMEAMVCFREFQGGNGVPRKDLPIQNFEEVIAQTNAEFVPFRKKYGMELVSGFGDVTVGSVGDGATLWLCADNINLVGKKIKMYATEDNNFQGQSVTRMYDSTFNMGGMMPAVRKDIHTTQGSLMRTACETQIAATQALGWKNALLAAPGIVVAGGALALSVVAAANHDPSSWGL